MKKYLKYFFVGLVMLGGAAVAIGATTSNQPTQQPYSYQQFTFFTATTTTATSTNTAVGDFFIIKGAKKVTMYFTHGGTATTSTTGQYFKVQSTRDGTNWNDFNKLIGADVSSTATSTYIISGATSTVPVALDLSDDTFYGIRCVSTEIAGAVATDGEATCLGTAEF
jgi:hypothetical protein